MTLLRELGGEVRRALEQHLLEHFPGRDPCDAAPEFPLVLLPVRLETRFSDDQRQLRVRIYPDEIHLDRLDEGLSDDERHAGTAYWERIWAGGTAAEESAWQELLHLTRPERAGYVAFALTPSNLASRPASPGAPGPAPVFPVTAKPSQAGAVARALPDRFVVLAIQGQSTSPASGNPIPPQLTVGLPRTGSESDLVVTASGVRVGAGMEWMVDYQEAEKVGMAVTVTLAQPGTVDRLLVMGLRTGLDPAASATELVTLLESHRFTRGLAFLAQGTPTNNTETDRTDWQPRPAAVAPPTRIPAALPGDANAARLASALGLDPTPLGALDHAGDREQLKAQATNTALWAPSYGTFLSDLIVSTPSGASLDDDRRERARDLFQDHVRGRGPLPALRVADQPYGILPTASVDRRWRPDGNDPLEPSLATLLRRIRTIWRASVENVPRLGSGPLDASLLDILGSSPVLEGLRVRSIASKTMCSTAPYIPGIQEDNTVLQEQLDLMVWGTLGFEAGTIGLGRSLGATTRPLGLPLVHERDPDFIAALLSGGARKVESVLQALLELAEDQEQRAANTASPPELVGSLVDRSRDLAGNLYAPLAAVATSAVQSTTPIELHALADRVQELVGPSGPSVLLEHQPATAIRGSLAEVALQPGLATDAAQSISLQAVGAWLRASARYGEFRDALTVLRNTTLQERQYLVAEALDLASHRLDAWITALPARRLRTLRAAQPNGAVIGAYGWLEDIEPGSAAIRDGGWIHAPSISHAATAGVLRSGYLTHNADAGGDGSLAIDLSSARVRVALDLLDGIRSGQPLAALLGYLIERRLHEHQLDRFVLSLRRLAPLLAGKLSDHGDALPQAAQEAIAANNVVDGVKLLTLAPNFITNSLATPPANNPYLDPSTWQGPSPDEQKTITDLLREAAAANDAVADLLLAEGVHQLVQGNTARAAAALDAAAAGDAPPVEADVVRSPTRGVAITHRILVMLPAGQLAGGWLATTPRAAAEPRLEAWAQAGLGPATDTVLHVASDGTRTTLAEAKLSALDVVYDAAAPGGLESRIRAAIPALGNAPLTDTRDPTWPAGLRPFSDTLVLANSLQRLLAGARVALPGAFARPNDDPTRTITDLPDLESRARGALQALAQAEADLSALLATPAPAAPALATAVGALAAFGIPAPAASGGTLSTLAKAVDAEARRRAAAAQKLLKQPFDASVAIATGKAIFGEAFWLVPAIKLGPPDRFESALGALAPGPAQVRRFLRDVATVRDGAGRYAETLLFADALGVNRTVRVAQLTEPGTPGSAQWIGLPFDSGAPSPDKPVTSIIVDAPATVSGADTVAGLVVDEWGEVAPRRVEITGTDGEKRREARAVTGVAVNATTPSSRAPQAILIAVSPDGQRWDSHVLTDTLEETLELAKLRAVTLERALWAGRVLPALQEQSWSLQGEKTIDIRFLNTVNRDAALRYVRD